MAGRRHNYSGISAGLKTVAGGINALTERDLNIDEERRDFDRRLEEAGIKAGLESGQIQPSFQQGRFSGFQQGQPQQQQQSGLLDMLQGGDLPSDVSVSQTIKTPQGTITIKRQAPKPQQEKQLSPLDQLRSDIRTASQGVGQAQQGLLQSQQQIAPQVQRLQQPVQPSASMPLSPDAAERLQAARGRAVGMIQQPVQQAQGLLRQRQQGLSQLQSEAGSLRDAGLIRGLNATELLGDLGLGGDNFTQGAQGLSTGPSGFPPAEQFEEGSTATDSSTGIEYVVRSGQWVPL